MEPPLYEEVQLLHETYDCPEERDEHCIVAAKTAAERNEWEKVKGLVQSVSNIKNRDQCHRDLAKSAAFKGIVDAVEFLVLGISDKNVRDQCCREAASSAAARGHIEIVQFLVRNISNREIKDRCCKKAASSAASRGHLEVVKLLVNSASDQSKRDQCCIEAVKVAAYKGQLKVVKSLMLLVSEQILNDNCCAWITESAIKGHVEVAKFIAQAVSDPSLKDYCCIDAAKCAVNYFQWDAFEEIVRNISDKEKRDQCYMEAVKFAAINGQSDVVNTLLPLVSSKKTRDDWCMYLAKFLAKQCQSWKIVADLVRSVSNPMPATSDGEFDLTSCLVNLVSNQQARDNWFKYLVKFLLKQWYGSEEVLLQSVSDSKKKDEFCLEVAKSAAYYGQLDAIESILRCHSKAPQSYENLRFECVVAACSRLHENVVAFFGLEPNWLFEYSSILRFTASMAIEKKNSVLTKTVSRMQPDQIIQLLRFSISQSHVALAFTLIKVEQFRPMDIDLPDSTGATALMLAADVGHHEIIKELLDLGASVRTQDSQGRTALSRACKAGHVGAVKALLNKGADASHRDNQGLTCVQVAERYGQQQVLRLMNSRESATSPPFFNPWITGFRGATKYLRTQSIELSYNNFGHLAKAGFTKERAECQQRSADCLEGVARVLTQEDRQMTGSYAEGWANSLTRVNGRTDADSDIDWTVLIPGQELHLDGGCESDEHSKMSRNFRLLKAMRRFQRGLAANLLCQTSRAVYGPPRTPVMLSTAAAASVVRTVSRNYLDFLLQMFISCGLLDQTAPMNLE
ncbi:hypothetical protein BOX15_Mlig018816g1 [Macrostomum lignano]|uniref:ANK_REP_REGION domain-containing protein n=1 Tax=Macrostomum lignano TaxID=282301 RepID=A0A267FPD3_9PLAT|nr:hypothetical protein BOX15_Mlig018816g1 [Macrostomum lignano]